MTPPHDPKLGAQGTGIDSMFNPVLEPPVLPEDLDLSDTEPDTARSYERAKPLKETGDSRLDCEPPCVCHTPDRMIRAVHNAHESHQLNSESGCDAGDSCPLE